MNPIYLMIDPHKDLMVYCAKDINKLNYPHLVYEKMIHFLFQETAGFLR